MTAKERVHAALRREPVDRIPIFMWYHPETVRRLAEDLRVPRGRLPEVLGDDVRQAWVGNNHAMEGITHEREGESHIDCWGIEWVRVGPFNQIRRSPLEEADEETARGYKHPYEYVGELLTAMEPLAKLSRDYFIGCDVSPCLFEMVCRVRGMEQAILDLGARRELAAKMLSDAAAFQCHLAEEACKGFALDWLWTGDDVAGQQAMLINPRIWRELVRPHLEAIVQIGKRHGLWVAHHCCGSLLPIIPDLIDIGVDVLNPIQTNCPGMDAARLKKEFGKHLSFMGGVDTQHLLPHGSASEVFRETRRLIDLMTSDGGGYILAASHTVPPETPRENIFALYAAAGLSEEEILDRATDVREH
ncbi:MAG: uroporphyrinogen decarboxylase family protein [Bacteroidota bacterium]